MENNKIFRSKYLWGGVLIFFIIIIWAHITTTSSQNNSASMEVNTEKNIAESQGTDTFVDKTIKELVQMLSTGNKIPLVKVQGLVTQKVELTDENKVVGKTNKSYWLKIEDAGSVAIIRLDENVLSKYSNGDMILVNGALGSLGDCSKPDSDFLQKTCQTFKISNANVPVIIPIKLKPTDSDIVIIKKISVSNSSTNKVSSLSMVTEDPKPEPKPLISLTYSQIMNGLSDVLTMGEFTKGDNHGYASDNSNLSVNLIVFGESKEKVSSVSFSIFDPSVGYDPKLINFPSDFSQYRTIHNKIVAQLLTNMFPNWTDRVEWLNGAVSSCKEKGDTQLSNRNSMKITVSCSTTLGMYSMEISHE